MIPSEAYFGRGVSTRAERASQAAQAIAGAVFGLYYDQATVKLALKLCYIYCIFNTHGLTTIVLLPPALSLMISILYRCDTKPDCILNLILQISELMEVF